MNKMEKVRDIMKRDGFSFRHAGTWDILAAIGIQLEAGRVMPLTKELYPMVAKKNKRMSWKNVEKNMRAAMKSANIFVCPGEYIHEIYAEVFFHSD